MTQRDVGILNFFSCDSDDGELSLMTHSWCPSSSSSSDSAETSDDDDSLGIGGDDEYFGEGGCVGEITRATRLLDGAGRPSDLLEALYAAARGNDVAALRLMLRGAAAGPTVPGGPSAPRPPRRRRRRWVPRFCAGLDPDAAEPGTGRTAAWYAACAGSCDALAELAGAGADLDGKSLQGVAPLHIATAMNEPSATRVLLELGADPEVRNLHGATAAWMAASAGHRDVLAVLIGCGVDVNAPDRAGVSPALAAARKGRTEALWLLCRCKADFERSSDAGDTCVTVAVDNNDREIIRVLAYALNAVPSDEDPPPNILGAPSASGEPPLCRAARLGHYEAFIQLLCAAPHNVTATDPRGRHALLVAAGRGRLRTVRAICNLGPPLASAALDAADDEGHAPLSAACAGGHADVAGLLIAAGADATPRRPTGQGPPVPVLLTVAREGHAGVARALLENGADAGVVCGGGHTALSEAAKAGHMELCRVLMGHGAGRSVRERRAAAQRARRYRHWYVAAFIEAAG